MKLKTMIRDWVMPEAQREINSLTRINEGLLSEVEVLRDKNKKCQENINKTNSYWKGLLRSRRTKEQV